MRRSGKQKWFVVETVECWRITREEKEWSNPLTKKKEVGGKKMKEESR
jgi:hypothetical protein